MMWTKYEHNKAKIQSIADNKIPEVACFVLKGINDIIASHIVSL